MEKLVREMQHPETGVPVRSHKTILNQLPCVFMGYEIIEWLMERLPMEDSAEAIHLANLLCQYGYFFPVPEAKTLTVKDNESYYRFQTPYFWPSQTHHVDNTEYAIYLVKRSMRNKQKHGLDEYEQESLAKLKKALANKWEFVCMQADEQLKLAKERKKMDKIVIDSQERAYWKVHWPQMGGGCMSMETATVPYKNMTSRKKKRTKEDYRTQIIRLKEELTRTRLKGSQAAETLIHQCEIYSEYDPFIYLVQPSNPWISDDPTYWMLNEDVVEVATEKRVRLWAISLGDLLSDPTGINEFQIYLKKEYSHENIRFWKAVRVLHKAGKSQVECLTKQIYNEFVVRGAVCEVNLDSRTVELTMTAMANPNRFIFDMAQQHVYSLMNKDSYPRFIRSDAYKSLLANAIQPSHKKRFFNFGGVGAAKKKNSPSNNNSNNQGNVVERKFRDVSLSGSTNDLRDQRDSEWSMTSNIIGHSLSASNLHDLNINDSPYRLSNSSGGSLTVAKPRALSTESCNTTPVHMNQQNQNRPMELTLEVPSSSNSNLLPDSRRSSGSSTGQQHSPLVNQTASGADACPWKQPQTTVKVTNEVCPWDED
ncbi:hypothetical protein CHUAL_003156 [Chamberlinius hualienensis]